jgi:SAM-dependent methyltransferase
MNSGKCSLCGAPIQIKETKLGVHCEGLVCAICGCNARNRFYYFVLNRAIREMGCTVSNPAPIRILEASSYGYVAMGDRYVELMKSNGAEVLCSDYNESNFKAVVKEDLSSLSMANESLDIICHSHVLEHVENDIKALEEAMRCLRPGGALLVSVPIQTDYTYSPENEYHGDNAYVFRRNGWDIISKFKAAGFLVDVVVPPEHVSLTPEHELAPDQCVLDNITFAGKFGKNFERYRELFYPACTSMTSGAHRFDEIWGQLELFIARKPSVD